MTNNIKSGKEIVDNFFSDIEKINNLDNQIALLFGNLYKEGKLTDSNVKNGLQSLRDKKICLKK
jgi:hypothetical protein